MKKINNIIIILSLIGELIFFILNPVTTIDNILLLLSYIPVIFIPRIFNYIFKKSKIKITDDIEFAYLIFLILAFLFGSIMGDSLKYTGMILLPIYYREYLQHLWLRLFLNG